MIDRVSLLEEIKRWLPADNTVVDDEIDNLVDIVILQVGDESSNFGEVFYKTMCLIVKRNIMTASTEDNKLRRDELGGQEIEFFQTSIDEIWKPFKDALDDIVEFYGYSPPKVRKGAMFINSGKCP